MKVVFTPGKTGILRKPAGDHLHTGAAGQGKDCLDIGDLRAPLL